MPISFHEDDPKNENVVLAARVLPLQYGTIRYGTSTRYITCNRSKKALDRSAMYMRGCPDI